MLFYRLFNVHFPDFCSEHIDHGAQCDYSLRQDLQVFFFMGDGFFTCGWRQVGIWLVFFAAASPCPFSGVRSWGVKTWPKRCLQHMAPESTCGFASLVRSFGLMVEFRNHLPPPLHVKETPGCVIGETPSVIRFGVCLEK